MNEEQTTLEAIRRAIFRKDLRQICEDSLDERVDRYLEINHQGVIGNHYFAAASAECIMLYRDGHFISTVMVSQAVNEGILKFVAERNDIPLDKHNMMIEHLRTKRLISAEYSAASTAIWKSFRNDVHHMNPTVAKVPFPQTAKQNIQKLALIEKEIFGVDVVNGKLFPKQPKYWDIQDNGTVPVFLRLAI